MYHTCITWLNKRYAMHAPTIAHTRVCTYTRVSYSHVVCYEMTMHNVAYRFLGSCLNPRTNCYTLEVSFFSYATGGNQVQEPYNEQACILEVVRYSITGLPIGYSVIVALTGLPVGHSVIVALTGLPIGHSVIVALTGLRIGYSVIVALTGLSIGVLQCKLLT